MSIRKLLLVAFLAVGIVPSVVLTLLAFDRTRSALQEEIEQGVLRSTQSASNEVDKLMFERMLNATTWNHLEVMQDIRLADVDKRLSAFLAEMKRRYGQTYRDLHAVDRNQRIIASSNPYRIGKPMPGGERLLDLRLPGGDIRLDWIQDDSAEGGYWLRIASPIASQYGEGNAGTLWLEVDLQRLVDVLERNAGPSRQLMVLGPGQRVIASTAELRERGIDPGRNLTRWEAPPAPRALDTRSGQPLFEGDVIVGQQASIGPGVDETLGWRTLLLQSRNDALQPIARIAWAFGGLLLMSAIATLLVAIWVSNRIARPVVALTEFTRNYLRPGDRPNPPEQGPREVNELGRSFVHLVDDLQRSQQTLVQASKLAALGEITALMAHEVRTPLGILKSSAQMLRTEPTLSPEGVELLGIVETETARLNRLVGSMLDSSRTRSPQFRPTDVHAIITHGVSLVAPQARERDVRIELALEADRVILDCDSEQITQVVLNLTMNALQILSPGGCIRIRTSSTSERFTADFDDDGPGVREEERGRIFEPFVFRREGGVGLGLAVVRQIARAHGGDVTVTDCDAGGARFRVTLPLKQNPES